MKKFSNSDLIRKLDFALPPGKPAYVSNLKTVTDEGFRGFISEMISKDEKRKADFTQKVSSKHKSSI